MITYEQIEHLALVICSVEIGVHGHQKPCEACRSRAEAVLAAGYARPSEERTEPDEAGFYCPGSECGVVSFTEIPDIDTGAYQGPAYRCNRCGAIYRADLMGSRT